jgi:hypothetical protein
MAVFDEAADTMVICPRCMKSSDSVRAADPDCDECSGAGMISGKRAVELLSEPAEAPKG